MSGSDRVMREWEDALGRLSIELSEDPRDFSELAQRMIALHGPPIEKLDGLDQSYWDFNLSDALVVLHVDVMAGVSIHVENGTNDSLLREVAHELTNDGQK